jgi:hypothetical protein
MLTQQDQFRFDADSELASRTVQARGFTKITMVLCVAAYIGMFNWVYHTYVSDIHGYAGFLSEKLGVAELAILPLLALAPSIWMPMRVHRPSAVIYWTFYLMVYVPSMFVPAYVQRQSVAAILTLSFALFVGFAVVGSGYLLPLAKFRRPTIPKTVFWNFVWLLAVGFIGYVVAIYKSNFKLVAFAEIYDGIRFESNDLARGSFVNYAVMLLGGAINPFLISAGLARRRFSLFFAGAACQFLMYATVAIKGYVLSVPLMMLFFLILRMDSKNFPFAYTYTVGLTALSALLNIIFLSDILQDNSTFELTLSILFMRTLATPGWATAYYQDFFSDHPLTFFSHVKGASWFVDYPYPRTLGEEIGFYYYGSTDTNVNAHCWATDGIAGGGLIGILVVSALLGLILWVYDSIGAVHHRLLTSLLSVQVAILLTNISLFTTLFSGGFGLIMLMLFVMPPELASVSDPPSHGV